MTNRPAGRRSELRRGPLIGTVAALLAFAATADAQYVQRKVVTTNGALTFIGNSLGLNKDDDDDRPGNRGMIGTFITTDTSLRDNSNWPFGTTEDWRRNGSAAILTLPAGSRVVYAELIWGGSYDFGSENVLSNLNDPVNFTTPNGTPRLRQIRRPASGFRGAARTFTSAAPT